MAIKVTLKNSVVQDSVPTTSHLAAVGELALNANINSLGIYMRASNNSIVKMAGPGSVTTPAASTTVAGIAELATSGETTTGTDTARVCTPAGVKAVTDAERTTSNNTYLAKAGGTLTGVVAATAGSNSAPAIHFGDSDSGIFGGTNTVSLAAGGATRLTADTGVSVVGALAVTGTITSTDDLTIPDKIIHSGDTDTAIRFPAANTVSVETGGSERARVDSGGRLLVGHSSGTAPGAFSSKISIEDVNSAASLSVTRNSANNGGPVIVLGKTRTATVGGTTIVQSGDGLGELRFYGADGTDRNSQAAGIKAEVDGTPGSNDMPGRLVFTTTADGAASPTTRLTIDSAGVVNVPDDGKFTAGASNDIEIYHESGQSYITNSTGNFRIDADNLRIRSKTDNEAFISASLNGAVELYHNNSKKFETTSGGIVVTGNIETNEHISLTGDNKKLKIGAGEDIQIYHDGSNSFIDNGTGALNLIAANDVVHKIHSDGTFDIGFGADNIQLRLGAGSDLKLYHDGSHSYIANTTGNLYINDDGYIELSSANGGEKYATFSKDGAVELYYDNSKKFETYNGGCQMGGDLSFSDNQVANFGTGSDLQVKHDGGNSFIANTGGNLYIRNNTAGTPIFYLQVGDSNEDALKATFNGAVELYHNNSKKIETASYGTYTSGTSKADHFSVNDSGKFRAGASDDLEIYHNGTASYIQSPSHTLYIQATTIDLGNGAGNEPKAKFHDDGAVELYYDSAKKLDTTSSGIAITGGFTTSGASAFNSTISFNDDASFYGASYHAYWDRSANALEFQDYAKATFGTGNDLEISHDGTDSIIGNGTGTLQVLSPSQMRFRASSFYFISYGNDETMAKFIDDGAVELYYNNVLKISTESSGAKVVGNWTLQKNSGGDASGVSSENLLFNTQSGDIGKINCFTQGGGGPGGHGGALRLYTKGNNSGLFERFRIQHDGSFLGSDTSIGSLSDSRLKKNVVDYTYDLTKFKELKPKTFDWINPEEHSRDTAVRGFLAQEVQVIDDYYVKDTAVINEKDQELITDGKPLSSILDANDAMYVSVIQQLMAKIETLETKVAALEGA